MTLAYLLLTVWFPDVGTKSHGKYSCLNLKQGAWFYPTPRHSVSIEQISEHVILSAIQFQLKCELSLISLKMDIKYMQRISDHKKDTESVIESTADEHDSHQSILMV